MHLAETFGATPWQIVHAICDPYHSEYTWRFPLAHVTEYQRDRFRALITHVRAEDPDLLRDDIRNELFSDIAPLLERNIR